MIEATLLLVVDFLWKDSYAAYVRRERKWFRLREILDQSQVGRAFLIAHTAHQGIQGQGPAVANSAHPRAICLSVKGIEGWTERFSVEWSWDCITLPPLSRWM
jgi:hypothetical protein